MKCANCGGKMIHIGGSQWACDSCNSITTKLPKVEESFYIQQEPYVDDKGIWLPYEEYVPEGFASNYRLVMTKEMFVEAYNRWIKEANE